MKRIIFIVLLHSIVLMLQAGDSLNYNTQYNSAERLLLQEGRLKIGGYGEVHYNQPFENSLRQNGVLDVHRIVLLFGYDFSERVSFITELEFEHVKEVYVEQAFLQYKLNNFINLRAGLLLVPMGIINEYHEPTTFNGVERPWIDKYIAPTTWREIGIGASGNIFPARLRYQLYLVNGFNGYDGAPRLNGSNGLRKGRQKGAESFISTPNYTGKIEYYGIRGLNIGLSGYFGKTQSTLYDGIPTDEEGALALADSSVVGVAMTGLDARYSIIGFQFRGQYYFTRLTNTFEYNYFTGEPGSPNDLGSALTGFYLEAGYNILRLFPQSKTSLIPFIRYETLDTQHKVEERIAKQQSNNRQIVTTGLTWKLTSGAVVKTDVQFINADGQDETKTVFNAGIGVMF